MQIKKLYKFQHHQLKDEVPYVCYRKVGFLTLSICCSFMLPNIDVQYWLYPITNNYKERSIFHSYGITAQLWFGYGFGRSLLSFVFRRSLHSQMKSPALASKIDSFSGEMQRNFQDPTFHQDATANPESGICVCFSSL